MSASATFATAAIASLDDSALKGVATQGEIGSSSAGINRIKFVGFAGQHVVSNRLPAISVHQHTPEQRRV